MLVDLLTFFAHTYRDVFGISAGPPLHDPLAVAAVLGDDEVEFYDYDPRPATPLPPGPAAVDADPEQGGARRHRPSERYALRVVTEGSHAQALAGEAQTGRTLATLLPAGEPGVRIPRGLDIPTFWHQLERCVARADAANAAAGFVLSRH